MADFLPTLCNPCPLSLFIIYRFSLSLHIYFLSRCSCPQRKTNKKKMQALDLYTFVTSPGNHLRGLYLISPQTLLSDGCYFLFYSFFFLFFPFCLPIHSKNCPHDLLSSPCYISSHSRNQTQPSFLLLIFTYLICFAVY